MTRYPPIDHKARNERIISLYQQGLKSIAIAAEVGCSTGTVAGAIYRWREREGRAGKPRPYTNTPQAREARRKREEKRVWNLEAEAERARRAAEQRALAEAENARRREQQEQARLAAVARAQSEAKRLAGSTPMGAIRHDPKTKLDPAEGVSILDIRFGQCRWVMPRKYRGLAVFCGLPTTAGTSWCQEHRVACFTKPHQIVRRHRSYAIKHNVTPKEKSA